MRKLAVLFLTLAPILMLGQADTTKYWTFKGLNSLNLNQVSFSNWTPGGTNNVSFGAISKLYANYKKNKLNWDNNLNMSFGLFKEEGELLKKSEDIIDFTSIVGTDISKHWSFAGYINFKSQFANGFDKDFDTVKISEFMAPGYLTVSPGFRYKPVEWFTLFLSPATAKFTFVLDQYLADLGMYGVAPAEYDTVNGIKTKDGENMLFYLGPFLEAHLLKEIAKGLAFESKLNILYSFTNRENLEPLDMDVSWENFLNYKIAKYFSASVFVHMVYYPGQPKVKYSNIGDVEGVVANRKIQLKQSFGIGITYNIPNE